MIWKRDGAGRQVSTDGRYAVQSDGYGFISEADREGSGVSAGITGGEWAAIFVATNENIDWFPTMKQAKACAEAHARRS